MPPETVAVFRGDSIYLKEASAQNVHFAGYPSFYLIVENKRLNFFVCRVKSVMSRAVVRCDALNCAM